MSEKDPTEYNPQAEADVDVTPESQMDREARILRITHAISELENCQRYLSSLREGNGDSVKIVDDVTRNLRGVGATKSGSSIEIVPGFKEAKSSALEFIGSLALGGDPKALAQRLGEIVASVQAVVLDEAVKLGILEKPVPEKSSVPVEDVVAPIGGEAGTVTVAGQPEKTDLPERLPVPPVSDLPQSEGSSVESPTPLPTPVPEVPLPEVPRPSGKWKPTVLGNSFDDLSALKDSLPSGPEGSRVVPGGQEQGLLRSVNSEGDEIGTTNSLEKDQDGNELEYIPSNRDRALNATKRKRVNESTAVAKNEFVEVILPEHINELAKRLDISNARFVRMRGGGRNVDLIGGSELASGLRQLFYTEFNTEDFKRLLPEEQQDIIITRINFLTSDSQLREDLIRAFEDDGLLAKPREIQDVAMDIVGYQKNIDDFLTNAIENLRSIKNPAEAVDIVSDLLGNINIEINRIYESASYGDYFPDLKDACLSTLKYTHSFMARDGLLLQMEKGEISVTSVVEMIRFAVERSLKMPEAAQIEKTSLDLIRETQDEVTAALDVFSDGEAVDGGKIEGEASRCLRVLQGALGSVSEIVIPVALTEKRKAVVDMVSEVLQNFTKQVLPLLGNGTVLRETAVQDLRNIVIPFQDLLVDISYALLKNGPKRRPVLVGRGTMGGRANDGEVPLRGKVETIRDEPKPETGPIPPISSKVAESIDSPKPLTEQLSNFESLVIEPKDLATLCREAQSLMGGLVVELERLAKVAIGEVGGETLSQNYKKCADRLKEGDLLREIEGDQINQRGLVTELRQILAEVLPHIEIIQLPTEQKKSEHENVEGRFEDAKKNVEALINNFSGQTIEDDTEIRKNATVLFENIIKEIQGVVTSIGQQDVFADLGAICGRTLTTLNEWKDLQRFHVRKGPLQRAIVVTLRETILPEFFGRQVLSDEEWLREGSGDASLSAGSDSGRVYDFSLLNKKPPVSAIRAHKSVDLMGGQRAGQETTELLPESDGGYEHRKRTERVAKAESPEVSPPLPPQSPKPVEQIPVTVIKSPSSTETTPIISSFDIGKAIDVIGFNEFLLENEKVTGTPVDLEDVNRVKLLFEAFALKDQVSLSLYKVYAENISRDTGLLLGDDGQKAVNEYIERQAHENPRRVVELATKVKDFQEKTAQVAALETSLSTARARVNIPPLVDNREELEQKWLKIQTAIDSNHFVFGAGSLYHLLGVGRKLLPGGQARYEARKELSAEFGQTGIEAVMTFGTALSTEKLKRGLASLEAKMRAVDDDGRVRKNLAELEESNTRFHTELEGIRGDVFADADLMKVLKGMARQKITETISGVTSRDASVDDVVRTQSLFQRALDASQFNGGEDDGYVEIAKVDEQKTQLDSALDKSVEKMVGDTITASMASTGGRFAKLEERLKTLTDGEKLGSKNRREVRELIIQRLDKEAGILSKGDAGAKLKAQMLKVMIAKQREAIRNNA